MKKIIQILFLLTIAKGFSQKKEYVLENNAEAERKSASKMLAMAVNPNTQNYDLTAQKLEFTVDPAVYSISGKVTHTFKAITNMTTITFDLYKKTTGFFTISSVKIGGANAPFSYLASHELVITLPTTLIAGNSSIVEIVYSGVPTTIASEKGFFTGTHGSPAKPVLWTLSEPFGARTWWPCKQDLTDKVETTDIYITAPSQYISVANGVEPQGVGYPLTVGANTTTYFKHNYPIPSYLVAIAVTNYQILNQTGGTTALGTFPIVNYLYPEEFSTSSTSLAVTPTIINFYETVIGPYPFRNEKYGHARANLSGGMEHSTVSFMNSWGRGLIAHEMAHQWFGDKVTCGTWKDIWLNESITEYMSGCFVEFADPPINFVNWKNARINAGLSYAGSDNNLYLTDMQAMSVDRIFDQPITYYKGALVVNMLRLRMGSVNFFQALRNYLAANFLSNLDPNTSYKHAVTSDFKLQLEAVYGSSLTEFFNDWIYGQGQPTYEIVAQNIAVGQVKFTVNQTQSDPSVSFFEMPVLVRVEGALGQQQDYVLENTFNGQEFIKNVAFEVTNVIFDPNKEIFSQSNTTILSNSSFDYFSKAIQLYPNPTSDMLEIRLPNDMNLKSVNIFNTLGQMVMSSSSSLLFVNTLASGLYSVSVETSEGTFHKNFIKK